MNNNELKESPWDGLHEECGVFGMYDFDGNDVASSIYYGLFALQHRGQESCGIAVSETNGPKGKVTSYKDMGLVNEVFTGKQLETMKQHKKSLIYEVLRKAVGHNNLIVCGCNKADICNCCGDIKPFELLVSESKLKCRNKTAL